MNFFIDGQAIYEVNKMKLFNFIGNLNNFQKLFLIGGKIFNYFSVTLYNVFKLYDIHKVH